MMKHILVLALIGFLCMAEEIRFDEFIDDLAEYTQEVDRNYQLRTEETRCGDFTELVGKDWQSRTFKIVNRIDKGKAIVTVIQDSAGPLYCVKQIRLDAQPKRSFQSYLMGHVRDVVASYVFESMNIRVNKVRIIPPNVPFVGKYYQDRIATLHTFALGSNEAHDFPFSLHLEQYLKSRKFVRDRGLTLQVIDDMSQHEDLPPIVAGDTFTSNPDRSRNNLFWDARTERWTGIDVELAFKLPMARNLSEIACYQIEKFLKTPGFSMSKKTYRGLEHYNAVLHGLIENNNPNDTCQLLKNVATYAHVIFVRRGNLIDSDHSFEEYCAKINAQYNSSKKLVRLIDRLLQSLHYLKRRTRYH